MSLGLAFPFCCVLGSSGRRRVFFTCTVPEVWQGRAGNFLWKCYRWCPLFEKVLAAEKVAILMCMHGFLLSCDKAEMNKFPSLHMAFINFPEIFKGQKGQAQQRKRANIFGNWANTWLFIEVQYFFHGNGQSVFIMKLSFGRYQGSICLFVNYNYLSQKLWRVFSLLFRIFLWTSRKGMNNL